jgi:hypothetical protein
MEIITLQIGHYANFVGSHFWNVQQKCLEYEETTRCDSDVNRHVLFRSGQARCGSELCTPRLVCIDLKGSLKTMKIYNQFYEAPSSLTKAVETTWAGEVQTYARDVYEKNAFLADLEKKSEIISSPQTMVHQPMPTSPKNPASVLYDLDDTVEVWSDYLGVCYHPKSVVELPQFQNANVDMPFDFYDQGYALGHDSSLVSHDSF